MSTDANIPTNGGGSQAPPVKLTRKDFVSDQEVRWCPGCGDYSILAQIQKVMPELDINIILFNNRIYGLTKGQYSPTSEFGKKTKSTPYGVIDYPLNPLSVALAAESTFVARSVDTFTSHLQTVVERAMHHKGVSFVEVYQ